MRALCTIVAVLAVLSFASSAHAQRKGTDTGGGGNSANDARKSQIEAEEKAAKEKAYQDAIKRIPASNEKQDPWKNAR